MNAEFQKLHLSINTCWIDRRLLDEVWINMLFCKLIVCKSKLDMFISVFKVPIITDMRVN
jgi:hypothetical protein